MNNDLLSLSLAEQTAARLVERILVGEIGPGERLSEAKLAATLDVSRNTLREVFRLLTRDGLLSHQPNRGVSVTTPTLGSILDIYRVRRMIEVPAVANGWYRHAGVARIRAAVERAEAAAEKDDWLSVGSANIEYHKAIVQLADSPRLSTFFSRLTVELRLAFGLLDSPEMLYAPYIPLNRAMLELIEAGEMKEASKQLDAYLSHSERTMMSAFAALE